MRIGIARLARLSLMAAMCLLLIGCQCCNGKLTAEPFKNPMMDKPKFPDNFGIWVQWSTAF